MATATVNNLSHSESMANFLSWISNCCVLKGTTFFFFWHSTVYPLLSVGYGFCTVALKCKTQGQITEHNSKTHNTTAKHNGKSQSAVILTSAGKGRSGLSARINVDQTNAQSIFLNKRKYTICTICALCFPIAFRDLQMRFVFCHCML